MTPTRRQIIRGYVVLPHAVPVITVLIATAAFAFVAARGWPGFADFVCLLGAMFGAQLAIGAVNELVDADLDAQAKPDKPIPSGLVSRRGARIAAGAGLLLMTLFSLRFSLGAFLLCALGAGTGIAYDYSLWFKRTIWGWVPYLIALPLLPIWVWSALATVDPALFAIYPIGASAVISVQIAQSLPDIDADRAAEVRTLAVMIGDARAHLACWGAMLLAAGIAALVAPLLLDHPNRLWLAGLVAALAVAVNALIWRVDRQRGVMAAFPCMALAAAALGVGWTLGLF